WGRPGHVRAGAAATAGVAGPGPGDVRRPGRRSVGRLGRTGTATARSRLAGDPASRPAAGPDRTAARRRTGPRRRPAGRRRRRLASPGSVKTAAVGVEFWENRVVPVPARSRAAAAVAVAAVLLAPAAATGA